MVGKGNGQITKALISYQKKRQGIGRLRMSHKEQFRGMSHPLFPKQSNSMIAVLSRKTNKQTQIRLRKGHLHYGGDVMVTVTCHLVRIWTHLGDKLQHTWRDQAGL